MDLVSETKIKYWHRSDHSIIELQIQVKKIIQGQGNWKFDSSLLKNKTYVELINRTIEETIKDYIAPDNNLLKIHDITVMEITLTIDDTLFFRHFVNENFVEN